MSKTFLGFQVHKGKQNLMDFDNQMEKEFQKHGSWIPATPAKPIPARPRSASVDGGFCGSEVALAATSEGGATSSVRSLGLKLWDVTTSPATQIPGYDEPNQGNDKRNDVSLKISATLSEEFIGEAMDTIPEPAAKSCKRTLSFNLESHPTVESTVTTGHNNVSRIGSAAQANKGKELMVENIAGMAYDFQIRSLTDYSSLVEREAACFLQLSKNTLTEYLNVPSGNRNGTKTASPCLNRGENGSTAKCQSHEEDIGKVVLPEETAIRKPESTVALMSQGDLKLVRNPDNSKCNNGRQFADAKHAESSMRDNCHTIEQDNICATNQTDCQCNVLQVYRRIFRVNQCLSNSRKLGPNFPKILKKRRFRRQKMRVTKKQAHIGPSLVNSICYYSESEVCSAKLRVDAGPKEVLQQEMIDSIHRLKNPDISDGGSQLVAQDQNAHGPYNGLGTLVPYERLIDPSKKRYSKPKISFDPETIRVWKLLMKKDGSKSIEEEVDEDKENWWEKERELYRVRVDSFIARMRLIQGDRCFSPWKGSVLDSVVGVFLTQNVSDHLSSSSFMSLIARFPLQSTSNQRACYEDRELTDSDKSIVSNIDAVWPEHKKKDKQLRVETELDFCYESAESKAETLVTRTEKASENTLFQKFYSHKRKKLSCDEIPGGGCTESRGTEHGKQRSSLCRLDDLKDSYASISSSCSHSPYLSIPLVPSNLEEDYLEFVGGFGNTKTKDACNIRKELELMRDFGNETIVQQKLSPGPHVATTVDHLVSAGKHSGPPECSSQAEARIENPHTCGEHQGGRTMYFRSDKSPAHEPKSLVDGMIRSQNSKLQPACDVGSMDKKNQIKNKSNFNGQIYSSGVAFNETETGILGKKREVKNKKYKKRKVKKKEDSTFDWDSLRKSYSSDRQEERSCDTTDSLDWEAVRYANVEVVSKAIEGRGMNNVLAQRIKDFLNRLAKEHGDINLEWLRDVPPDKAKDYLLSIRGLGLKSAECVRLLTLHHVAFPVDTNVGRIAVRLGWVPIQPLPETLQIHLLDKYPLVNSVQKYLWPRLCTLDQDTLYELHYHMITFGKVFCTKRQPNCNACPMRGECKHYASAFASARLALPGPSQNCEPIVEVPASPEPECTEILERDIEDILSGDSLQILTIKPNITEFAENLQNYTDENDVILQEGDMSKALVVLTSEAASIPRPKLKYVSRLRTEHQVYELPDTHPLLIGQGRRVPDDPFPFLLAIWTPGETANSFEPLKNICNSKDSGELCNEKTCFSCNSIQEQNSQTIRGTFLIPCRTAMGGRFPLNGTYFQVNEVFADDESSQVPMNVPREWIWNLQRRTVYFGTSTSTILRGLSTEEIQHCFQRGFVCVRGFNQKTLAPRPLASRFHRPASKMGKKKTETSDQ